MTETEARDILDLETIHPDIESILVARSLIGATVAKTAQEIDRRYAGKKLLLAGVLKGSFIYLSDLVRSITIPHEISFLQASSYGGGTESSGNVRINVDLTSGDLSDTHILLAEDIVDSGNTLQAVMEYFRGKNALSVSFCTLLDKPERRKVPVYTDFPTIVIPDEFVVGYGLDFAEKYRYLPYIGILRRSVYE